MPARPSPADKATANAMVENAVCRRYSIDPVSRWRCIRPWSASRINPIVPAHEALPQSLAARLADRSGEIGSVSVSHSRGRHGVPGHAGVSRVSALPHASAAGNLGRRSFLPDLALSTSGLAASLGVGVSQFGPRWGDGAPVRPDRVARVTASPPWSPCRSQPVPRVQTFTPSAAASGLGWPSGTSIHHAGRAGDRHGQRQYFA